MEYESLVIAGLVQILEFLSAQGIREPELFGGALNSEEVDKIEALLGRGMAVDFESSHPRDAAAALKNLIQETKKFFQINFYSSVNIKNEMSKICLLNLM